MEKWIDFTRNAPDVGPGRIRKETVMDEEPITKLEEKEELDRLNEEEYWALIEELKKEVGNGRE